MIFFQFHQFHPQTDIRHNPEAALFRRNNFQHLKWCTELKFLQPNVIADAASSSKLSELDLFPGNKLKLTSNDIVQKTSPLTSVTQFDHRNFQHQKYGSNNILIESSTLRDNNKNEFNGEKVIALASFPGSGNTWLRYLLQQATGIYTGSVYKDYGLLKSGFPAENISNSSVLIVKTHEFGPSTFSKFRKAVLLVRDPAKAILAEFNRQSGGHVGFASIDR
jgi:hypothetical protein